MLLGRLANNGRSSIQEGSDGWMVGTPAEVTLSAELEWEWVVFD